MPYKLDRTKFKMQSFQEADNNRHYWLKKSFEERLTAAWYLISCAYNFKLTDLPLLEKHIFSSRKHKRD